MEKISGVLSLSLSLSVLEEGRKGKETREEEDAFIHAAACSFFTIYFASARGKGFIG